ncbi:cysteine desulfurase [Herbiconiux sp. VKM Ac-1786]|uniref:cysteine desulfurase family protein n=1 Tax=Herbiconiux sp. VKM Ac-1786 TaxID=2783824 RepID=UPI001889D3D0|nr:cysteine desulfurase [Herbiconiux sp. VKM Ac-1786]
MIHLDAAATTPVRREVLEAMWPFLTGEFGNPSSHHALGDAASRALAGARRTVAEWLGCRPAELVFTSGGTEGANLAVKGLALGSPRGRHVVLSAVEHPAVVESVDHLRRLHGFDVTVVPVDGTGLVDPSAFADALRDDTTLASVMLANNEIGTVQPVTELAAIAHARGVPVHTDAVQAAGWLDLRLDTLGVDAVSISGHKLGAPKGIGAVAVRGRHPLEPVLHGGGQERGRRSGTENVAFAVGLARAVELAEPGRAAAVTRTTALRDGFVAEVLRRVDGAVPTGHPDARLPSIASFCFPGTSGEAVLLGLEERGVIVSSGSACAAGSDEPSPVLLAIGLDPAVARTAVRFTFTAATTADDLAAAAASLEATIASLATLR